MEYDDGDIAEDGAGNFLVYKYGSWHPSDESGHLTGPIDASAKWGAGARELPNGTIERIGPRGGVSTVANGSDANNEGVGKLTEGQGKSIQYGLMMRGAEADYQRARRDGYDPGSIRNQIAGVAGIIPFDGDFFGRAIRDDVSDAGRQAELRWAEGNLRQLTGAAATNPEIARVAAINFDRGNDELAAQRFQSRADTYRGTRFAAGPGAAALGEYPEYSLPGVGPTDENGLPTYPSIDRILEQAPAATPAPQASGAGPGPGPVAPVDISGMSATDLLALPPGTAIRLPGGTVTRLTGAPSIGAQGKEVSPGVFTQESPDDAQARYREDVTGADRQAAGFMRGVVDTATFGLSDEIAAGIDTVLPPIAGQRSGWQDGFGQAYQQNVQNYRAFADADAEDVGGARIAGQVAGAFIPGTQVIGAARGANLATRIGRGAVAGAAYGGAYGFGSGEGNAIERLPSAGKGAAIGAVAGGASPVALNVAGRVATPVGNALSDGVRFAGRQVANALGENAPVSLRNATETNALARGLERFAGTNRPDINALNGTRAQLENAVGRPVAAASVINTGGRAMLRGVATRSDGAREIAENFGQGTAEALPARVGQQGRRILSNDTRSPDEIRAALDAERSNMARTTYAEPYAQPVEIGEDIAGALSGAPGRAAIQRARSAAEAWQDTAVMAELDALDAAARAGQPLPQVSAGAVDRIRQAMAGRGEKLAQNPATRAVGAGVQNRAGQVDGALNNVEGLAPARAAYRDASRQIEAVDAGERFMGSSPDTVAADMRGAPASAQAPFRAAAARSIERAAGSTQTAPGVANRLAIPGTPQRQMMDETLGSDDARRLSDAMRGERDIYRGAQQVDPGVGSQTTNNAMKAGEAAGMVGDALSGRPLGVVRRVVGMLDSRGFNPQQAEAVLEAMTDPSRTDEVISILSQRMSRREARNLTRALRYQLTIGLQSGQQN